MACLILTGESYIVHWDRLEHVYWVCLCSCTTLLSISTEYTQRACSRLQSKPMHWVKTEYAHCPLSMPCSSMPWICPSSPQAKHRFSGPCISSPLDSSCPASWQVREVVPISKMAPKSQGPDLNWEAPEVVGNEWPAHTTPWLCLSVCLRAVSVSLSFSTVCPSALSVTQVSWSLHSAA